MTSRTFTGAAAAITPETITERRDAIADFLSDAIAIERLTKAESRRTQLAAALAESMSPAEVAGAMEARLACRRLLELAVAVCREGWVDNGRVHLDGARAAELMGRLERFNRVPAGHARSLAAFYFSEMFGEAAS